MPKDLKYVGQGEFTLHLGNGREIPYSTGTVVKGLNETEAADLLARQTAGKPDWEPADGKDKTSPATQPSNK